MKWIEGDVMTEKVKNEEELKAQEADEKKVEEAIEKEETEKTEPVEETPEEDSKEEENNAQLEELQKKYDEKQKEAEEYLNMLKRTMADFDNYRKRTAKEKEGLFDDGYADAVKNLLPVLDNLERAEQNSSQQEGSLYEGVKMVLKIFRDLLEKSGVKEIEAEGIKFDPDYHNAILHVEDDSVGENIIVEVFQRGFIYKGKVIRHSLVKVAN